MPGDLPIFATTSKWLNLNGWPYVAQPLTTSTSGEAKLAAFSDPEHIIYLADLQTEGRGRGPGTWSSPASGTGLMATWSFLVPRSPQPLCAPVTGLAVFQAASLTWPDLPWSLKPPNDLYLNDRKIGGLLVESISRGEIHRLLIGFGFNVFSAPLTVPIAGNLSQFLHHPLTEAQWFQFLDRLHSGFLECSRSCDAVVLSPGQRLALSDAVRRHPACADLKDISPEGNLIYSRRTVNWFDL